MSRDILVSKLNDIKKIINEEINKHEGNDSINKKYNTYLKSFSSNNVGVAILSDEVIKDPKFNTKILFALSNWNEKDDLDKPLIDSLNNSNIDVCFENKFPYYKLKRLNEKLEFKEAPEVTIDNYFMQTKKTCCERKFIEFIKGKYVQRKLKEFEQSGNYPNTKEGIAQMNLDAESVELEGTIDIYTRLEPCIYCFDLMKKFKLENPKLTLRVYHDYSLEEIERQNEIIKDREDSFKQSVKAYVILQTTSSTIKVSDFFFNRVPDNLSSDQLEVLGLIDQFDDTASLSSLISDISGESPKAKLKWLKTTLEDKTSSQKTNQN